MNNLQDILYFPIKDSDSRKKMLIASVMSLASFIVPILPWIFVMGYAGEIMRRIIVNKEEPHMPEWNWNEYLPLGGKLFGVYFIYAIPMMIPMFLGYFMMIIPAILMDPEVSGRHSSFPPELMLVGTFGGMALFGLGMLFSLLLFVILPPAMSHTAAKNSFAAGFQIREWWRVYKANFGGFILSMIIAGGLYMVLIFAIQIVYITIILCFLVPFLMSAAMTYMTIITFALFGKAYRDGEEKLASKPI
jgi:hypothetical protein